MLRNRALMVILAAAVAGGLLLSAVSAILKRHVTDLNELWNAHHTVAQARQDELVQLRKSFGYGGFIHHFKNYVIRRDDRYVPLIEQSFLEAQSAVQALELHNISNENRLALQTLNLVLADYNQKYHLAQDILRADPDISVPDLDARVRVDDAPAYNALDVLSKSLSAELNRVREETNRQFNLANQRILLYQFIVMPLVYLGVIGCIVYLLKTNNAYVKLKAIFASTPDALVVINEQGRIIEYNNNALEVFGYTDAEFRQLNIDDLVPDGSALHHQKIRQTHIREVIRPGLQSGKFQDVMGMSRSNTEFQAKTKQGLIPVEVELTGFYAGRQLRILASVRDLTHKKKLEFAANNDGLTGLANRRSAELMLNKELARAKRYKRNLSVVLLDLDFFKAINDRYGHNVGDEALIAVAKVLSSHVRASDMASRFGGEEFLLIYPETDLDVTFTLAESIRRDIEALKVPPIERITASIGVSVYRGNENINTIDLLLKQADKALYQAKEHGRNQVCSRDGEDEGQHV